MNEIRLHVVLRVCDKVPSVHFLPKGRVCGDVSKLDIIKHSVGSLIESIKAAGNNNILLSIVDDHSSQNLLDWLNIVLPKNSKIIHTEQEGNGKSIAKAYEIGVLTDSDIVYFVEDDYLHHPDAIAEMVDSFLRFTRNLGGKEVALSPIDDPLDYVPESIKPYRIVQGARRHWKTNDHTTFSMMISRNSLIKHWNVFQDFSRYGEPGICEDNTINLMYRGGGVYLFSPLPALAVHLCDKEDVLADWRSWWYNHIKNISLDAFFSLHNAERNDFTTPKNKYQESDELAILLLLCKKYNVKRVLEIGINKGDTAKFLLDSCDNIEKYVGVDMDIKGLSTMTRQQDEVMELGTEAGIRVKDHPKFKLILSEIGSKAITDKDNYDLILIDGDHSQEWVKHDTDLALRLIKDKGIILWHDCGIEKGVTDVVNNLSFPTYSIGRTRFAVAFIGDTKCGQS